MDSKIMIIGYGSTGKYVLDMATKMKAFETAALQSYQGRLKKKP